MGFEKISLMLGGVKSRVKDGSTMEAAYVLELARFVFRNIYDEELWDEVKVVFFKKGVLSLQVTSSVVGHAVKMKEGVFCRAVEVQTGVKVERVGISVG